MAPALSISPLNYPINPNPKSNPKPTIHSSKPPNFLSKPPNPQPISIPNDNIKMPTPPWMKSPPILETNKLQKLPTPKPTKGFDNPRKPNSDRALIGKESGGRGKKAMKNIYQRIEKLQKTHNSDNSVEIEPIQEFKFEFGFENEDGDGNSKKMPWAKAERVVFRRVKKEKVVTEAELRLDGELLGRLRSEAVKLRKWVKVKKIGVSDGVVDEIKLIWKNNELVMVKFDEPLCRNMDRAREIVEIKTGGLVVWSRKDTLVIFRGLNYHSTSRTFQKKRNLGSENRIFIPEPKSKESAVDGRIEGSFSFQPIDGSLYERETDRLLDGLGPRFIDWWRPKPLPVDADLLPEVVPGFMSPYRLCPPNVRPQLTDDELTHLRKIARPLPAHFVLGRNTKLEGLADAILKLWEKCHIVKIALKLGVPNTNNEQMANELKSLTGGVLLLRNKFYIILYRGNDFLTSGVANLISERELELKRSQLHEESARLKAIESFYVNGEPFGKSSSVGTLKDFEVIQTQYGKMNNENWGVDVRLEAEKDRLEKELRKQEHKLFILRMKIEKSEEELLKLNSAWSPSELDWDRELITDEERECFQKLGLKMERSLVLGRRGVYIGVIEGLHQNWKHREVVKVITMQRVFSRVIYTAKSLETESGGILVSVNKLKEGYAIILYRGKNYRRPNKLAFNNLLTKREALHRSLQMQSIGSLKFFAYQRQLAISELNSKLEDVQKRSRRIDERI